MLVKHVKFSPAQFLSYGQHLKTQKLKLKIQLNLVNWKTFLEV